MRGRTVILLALVVSACGGDDDGDDGGGDSDPVDAAPGVELSREFPTVEVAAGAEKTSTCLSWRLDNEEPVFVNTVTMSAGQGWHHSNWFYVPEGTFSVDDGVWECGGEFDEISAALSGGVLFAQSTQVTEEVQAFGPGAALALPPHAVVVSQIHLLNAGDQAIETGVTMTLNGIAEADVTIPLHPLALDFHQLAIPPQQRSRFVAECDLEEAYGLPLDMSIYYVLPHYHGFATGMNIELFGGDRDGETVYSVESRIGEPLGGALSPPLPIDGASGLRFGCSYDNTTERTIGYGNTGVDEMCVFLAFTDSPVAYAGGVVTGQATERGVDGDVTVFGGECTVLAFNR